MVDLVRKYIYIVVTALLLVGCSVSKFVPEGKYLLDEVHISSDNKEIKSSEMYSYVRQKPNSKWFSLVKLPMYIYCSSGKDSTKWINKILRKMGDAPRIYDARVAEETRMQILGAVQNKGYLGAQVSLEEKIKKNKLDTYYRISSGKPYIISSIDYNVEDYVIRDLLMNDSIHSGLKVGERFDVNQLEEERNKITQFLLNRGYYRFNKDYITFQADTVNGTYRIDLTMNIGLNNMPNSSETSLHRQYSIRNVNYLMDVDYSPNNGVNLDTMSYGGINILYDKKLFLRPGVIDSHNRFVSGKLYSNRDVMSTYSSLSRLGILKYSNIRFVEHLENDSAYLDAFVSLSKNKNKMLSFQVEGTNSAGDLGAAASVTYTHRNLFKGSETFTIKVRGAYEAVTGLEGYANNNYTEYGVESSLDFPEFMFPFLTSDFKKRVNAKSEVSIKYNWQIRPEFERTLASAAWSYRWNSGRRANHRLDVLDINYIYMPYRSNTFIEYLNYMDEVNPLLRYSYEDLFIVRLGYTYTYNSAGVTTQQTAKKSSYSIRFNIEESGNLIYGFSKLIHKKPSDGESFRMGNISFAQYVKTDFDFAKNIMIDDRNSLVLHIATGVAIPYGNSKSLPFEKLYFSGGANSVRGWSVRSLGPGRYHGNSGSLDYVNHTGDIKLDLNVEYRTHLFWKLNGAAFIDAGNVWTLKSRYSDDTGQFAFNRFYKEIAVSYGLGVRFDLDFLILRFDGGMKAINPMESGADRFPVIKPDFSRDFAFHFAVGYPF
ncbi:Outer membrane protein/protective antigen OMA87 [uncultured Bacteroides sp.]|uniref:translocation and assembly module lipoprotein TamL n=1 Tax=Bacteroides cellulolyticus TaxID=2981780 RepID=UPI0008206AFA|nr:BamA/TamA family outer membrane protein [Bacteroides cellulolyticus]MCU6771848.1 BamA/TamA family outer membrane protein [Bacteroides cellulolyticus]SCI06077.1 Outer membrane protein/protective antigen OMA87 [uncultured Bacteroides sp.]